MLTFWTTQYAKSLAYTRGRGVETEMKEIRVTQNRVQLKLSIIMMIYAQTRIHMARMAMMMMMALNLTL